MKRLRISIGLAVAMVAGISAYATANNFRLNNYFYIDTVTLVCTPVQEPKTCAGGAHTCTGSVAQDFGLTLFNNATCTVILKQP